MEGGAGEGRGRGLKGGVSADNVHACITLPGLLRGYLSHNKGCGSSMQHAALCSALTFSRRMPEDTEEAPPFPPRFSAPAAASDAAATLLTTRRRDPAGLVAGRRAAARTLLRLEGVWTCGVRTRSSACWYCFTC